HDFTVLPFSITVHAPQFEVSQPTWVPVSPADSRMKWTRSVRGSIKASLGRPLIVILTCCLFAMREDPFCGLCSRYLPARSTARDNARLVSSLTSPLLYSAGPRRSEPGWACSDATCAACASVAASGFLPLRKSSALRALIGVGPTLVSPMPTLCTTPPPSRV